MPSNADSRTSSATVQITLRIPPKKPTIASVADIKTLSNEAPEVSSRSILADVCKSPRFKFSPTSDVRQHFQRFTLHLLYAQDESLTLEQFLDRGCRLLPNKATAFTLPRAIQQDRLRTKHASVTLLIAPQ